MMGDFSTKLPGVYNANMVNNLSGTLTVTHGGTNLTSTTINQILYSSANNVIAGLVTANNGVLITSAGGVPSISSTLPSAVQLNITSTGTIGAGTWQGGVIAITYGGTGLSTYAQGDLVYASASNVLASLAKNTSATRYLANTGASNAPNWDQINLSNGVTSQLVVSNGGTGLSTATTAYGVVCAGTTATGNFQVLASLGSSGQVLTSNGPSALPSFQAAGAATSIPDFVSYTYAGGV